MKSKPLDKSPQILVVNWLSQKSVHAGFHAPFLEGLRGISSECCNVYLMTRERLPDLHGSLEPIHHRHVAIHKYQFVI